MNGQIWTAFADELEKVSSTGKLLGLGALGGAAAGAMALSAGVGGAMPLPEGVHDWYDRPRDPELFPESKRARLRRVEGRGWPYSGGSFDANKPELLRREKMKHSWQKKSRSAWLKQYRHHLKAKNPVTPPQSAPNIDFLETLRGRPYTNPAGSGGKMEVVHPDTFSKWEKA